MVFCWFLAIHSKLKYFLTLKFYNEKAEDLFFKLLPEMRAFPSLVYLDQNGVKFISKEYLAELETQTKTDFLYFVSSSFFRRYGSTPEFRKVLEIDIEELERENYKNMHRLVLAKLRSKLKKDTEVKLFPFSIQKNANIYGIIFGSKSYRAVDKFLSNSWKRNALNGEADFDIDDDIRKNQLDIFGGKKFTKIEKFKSDLENCILNKTITNNKSALIYTYLCGHIPQHAVEVIKELRAKGNLTYDSKTPALNYDNVFKKGNIVEYKVK